MNETTGGKRNNRFQWWFHIHSQSFIPVVVKRNSSEYAMAVTIIVKINQLLCRNKVSVEGSRSQFGTNR